MGRMLLAGGFCVAALAGSAIAAEEPFDACLILTQSDAEKALGTTVAGEPVNPKVKRPRVVTSCAYTGFKDSKPVEARAQFKLARNEADSQKAFDESKLQLATKPLLIKGADAAFWSAKTGQMNVRKGRTWVLISVGPTRAAERDVDQARKLAEALAAKL